MGGVAVLHPQDMLKDRLNYFHNPKPLISSTPKRSSMKFRGRNPNLIPNSNPNPNFTKSSNRRKRSPQKKNSTNDLSSSPPPPANKKSNLVMGQVKILKRGEALNDRTSSFQKDDCTVKKKDDSTAKKKDENQKFDEGSRGLLAAGAEHISLVDFYAGSAFFSSPEPSDLPVPAFFKKKSDGVLTESNSDNKNATSDLLRILKLKL